MKKVALVIDNSAYLYQEDLDILKPQKIVPISFIVNGEEYYENVNMTYEQFYQFLQDKKTTVSTSQPSIEVVKEAWREVLKNYDEIVHVMLSSGLSEACNTATNASLEEEFFGKVFVANNQRVSFLNKFAMYEARYLIDQGKSAQEVKDYLEKTKDNNGIYIAVDTLKYLKKGGRVTPAAAAIGTLLNIKPILQIHGGKLDAYAKPISMKVAKMKMINAVKKEVEERFLSQYNEGKVYLGVAHTMPNINAQEIEDFVVEIKDAFPNLKIFTIEPLPLFIACHTGPKALAVAFSVDEMGIMKEMKNI